MNLLRLGKVGIFIIAIVCFNSCKTLELIKATKKLHIAGRSDLNNYFKYSFIIKSEKPFTIKMVSLISKDVSQKIEKYSFVNLKNHAGHVVLDDFKKFKKGNYKFNFKTNDHKNLKELIHVEYMIKTKKYSKKLSVVNLANRNDK